MSRIFLGYPPPKIKEFIIEHYGPKLNEPLTFTAIDTCSMCCNLQGNFLYSYDNGITWTDRFVNDSMYGPDGEEMFLDFKTLNANTTLMIKASDKNNGHLSPLDDYTYAFKIQGNIKISGNIMTLFDSSGLQTYVPEYGLTYMFQGVNDIHTDSVGDNIDVSQLILPATTINEHSYSYTFNGICSTAPIIADATSINGESPYRTMFAAAENSTLYFSNKTYDQLYNLAKNYGIFGDALIETIYSSDNRIMKLSFDWMGEEGLIIEEIINQ